MDTVIIVSVVLIVLSIGLALRDYYIYFTNRQELNTHISQLILNQRGQKKNKRNKLSYRIVKKLTKHADDFSTIGHRINFFSESQEIESLLMKAGYPFDLTVDQFQGLKIVLALIGFITGIGLFILGFPLSQYGAIFLPLMGFLGTVFALKSHAKKRQEQLRLDLPDFLDTLSVSLQAGIGMDQALREIIKYFDGPIHEEFVRYNQEIELGVSREHAYRELIKRNDNPEFQSLIKALIQGLKLGVPIATTIKHQAEDLRIIRKEQVKEKAAKASPKITLITTLIIAPTAVIMLGALMILNMFFKGDNNLFNMFNF